jgi:aromatic-L-amino-acid decarboxylase
MLGGVLIRLLETDGEMKLRGDTLARAMKEDKDKGLVPFFVVATLGTTSCCSFDDLPELGAVCRQSEVWLHVDAAYAGSAFICPEYRPLLNGVDQADSFNFNPHKWLLVNFDCSAMWVRDANEIENAFRVDPLYLRHAYQDNAVHVPDYRHWHVPLGRRFRSLKLWFVMRLYGQHGLRTHIRKQIGLAHEFEDLVRADGRFKVVLPVTMGLVVFRLVGDNSINEELNKRVNAEGKIHLTPSTVGDLYILRFAVCSRLTQSSDVEFAFLVISRHATGVLAEQELSNDRITTV